MRHHISGQKTNDWDKRTKHRPSPTFSLEIAKEARPYRVSDSEKEQQEQHRLCLVRDGHMKKVTDKNSSKQRTGDHTQADTAKLQPPNQVPDANGEVNCHFWISCEYTG